MTNHPRSIVLTVSIFSLALLASTVTAADELVEADAKVKQLADGFSFTEGPACDAQGNIYFTDIPNGRIHKWSLDGKLSTFREDSGGANGLFFDGSGKLLACEGGNRRVTSIAPDGQVTVLADSYDDKKLNSPNDLWIDPKGGVYFSDPRYGNQEGLEQDGFHVYYLPPDRKRLLRVIDNLVKPNGIVGTAGGNETLRYFAVAIFTTVTIVGLTGCGDQPSQVDTAPFFKAIDDYLDSNNMGMAVKQIKEGPVLDGDTAKLTASLSRKNVGGPAVTWTFHFNRQQDGKWSVVKHE